jgi:hypothetical protein
MYKARLGHVTLPVTDVIESFGSQASETVSAMVGGASSNVVNDILDVMVSVEEEGTLRLGHAESIASEGRRQ